MRFVILMAALFALGAEAATIRVANNSELRGALSRARGGDTLLLSAGNYTLNLNGTRKVDAFIRYNSQVSIKSLQASNPAVFTSVRLLGARNLTFDGVTFRSNSTSPSHRLVELKISESMRFINSRFIGQLTGGYGTGFGFHQSGLTEGLEISNNSFTGFQVANALFVVDGLTVRDNEYTNISYDVMIMNFVYNALVQNNYMQKRSRPNNDSHQDLIQLGNNGVGDPSHNVTIRGNELYASDAKTHGIYIDNLNAKNSNSQRDYFRNIVIENNIVNNAQTLGITVGHAIGVTIRNNDVQKMVGVKGIGSDPVIRVSQKSSNVTITGNRTTVLPFAGDNERNWARVPTPGAWRITGNIIVPRR